MKKEKSPATIFATSFVLSLAVLLILVMIMLSTVAFKKETAGDKTSSDLSMTYYRPSADDDFSLLLILCRERSELPFLYAVLEISPYEKTVTVTEISPETEVNIGTRRDTFNGHYDYAGSSNAKKAAENILFMPIDRYVRIDKNGFINLIDALGGFEVTLSKAYKSDRISLPIGKNLLNGKIIISLLEEMPNAVFSSAEEFFKEWYDRYFGEKIVLKSDYFFTAFLNNTDNDITQFDYLEHKKALRYLLEADDKRIVFKK